MLLLSYCCGNRKSHGNTDWKFPRLHFGENVRGGGKIFRGGGKIFRGGCYYDLFQSTKSKNRKIPHFYNFYIIMPAFYTFLSSLYNIVFLNLFHLILLGEVQKFLREVLKVSREVPSHPRGGAHLPTLPPKIRPWKFLQIGQQSIK